MKKSKLILSVFLISLTLINSACTTYTIKDNRIRVHFIQQGEKAPFDGMLLNKYTYKRLKECCVGRKAGKNN